MSLPAFGSTQRCEKCGYSWAWDWPEAKYFVPPPPPERPGSRYHNPTVDSEALERTCPRCNFKWDEAVLP